MLSIVQRPFSGTNTGVLLQVGELIDTSGWRLERQLREQNFIRPATEIEIKAAERSGKTEGAEVETAAAAPKARKAGKAVKARKATKRA